MSADPIQLQPGAVVAGRYRVEGTLGQGGMAVVYRARHLGTDKECALKLLFPELADDPKLRELFLQEARVSGRIGSCPYIVDVFDTGIDDSIGAPFIAMELLRGSTLGKRLRHRTIDRDDVPAILMQIAKGLEAAHKAGVVHRDLKPGNIFLTEDDEGHLRVKVLDFGIAKVLEGPGGRTATQAGSPWYSAPEQLGASMRKLAAKQGFNIAVGVSPATDVWAFGLCACELVLGLRANRYWEADTSADLMIRIALEPRRPPSARLSPGARVVPGFDDWFLRCTAHDAAARYQSTLEAARALVALLQAAEQAGAAPVAGPVVLSHAATDAAAEATREAPPTERLDHAADQAVARLQGSGFSSSPASGAGPGAAWPPPGAGTHVSQIVRQGSSQALAGQGAEQALSVMAELRAGAVATPVPTDGSGSSLAHAQVAPTPSTPSALGFSDAGVRGDVSAPFGAQTSSSWQHSAVQSPGRKRLAIVLALGAGIFSLLLVALLVGATRSGSGSEVGASAASAAPAEAGPASSGAAQEGVGEGQPPSAAPSLDTAGASALGSAAASGEAPDGGGSGSAAASASSTATAGAGAGKGRAQPRPEGKERVFEDF